MNDKDYQQIQINWWRERAVNWRNSSDYNPETVLQYAHECELFADYFEQSNGEINLRGY